MKGAEAAAMFRGLSSTVRARDEVTADELMALLSAALGVETLSQKRARAGRSGGLRSVESRREHDGTAQPKQDRSKPPLASEATTEANRHLLPKQPPKQDRSKPPLASGPSLGSLPDLPEKEPKESVVAPKDLTGFPRGPEATTASAAAKIMTSPAEPASGDGAAGSPQARDRSAGLGRPARPRNHAEALAEPAASLAELCRSDALCASLVEVHRMPWVVEPIRAWHEAGGDTRPLNLESNDCEVRAIVELTARGYLKSDLVRVARYLRTTEKYRDRVLASSMTKAVVNIALAELAKASGPRATAFAGLPRPMFGKAAAE